MTRTNIAKRLGRLTGGGIFAESQKLGQSSNGASPGSWAATACRTPSTRATFLAWGDTTLARYPLGIFDMTSATSSIQPLQPSSRRCASSSTTSETLRRPPRRRADAGQRPDLGKRLGQLARSKGAPRLVGTYVKIKPPMDAYEAGLCVWDDGSAAFKQHRVVWTKTDAAPKQPPMPDGHPALWKDVRERSGPCSAIRCQLALPRHLRSLAGSFHLGGAQTAGKPRLGRGRRGGASRTAAPSPGIPVVNAGSRSSWKPSANPPPSANCGTPRRMRPTGHGAPAVKDADACTTTLSTTRGCTRSSRRRIHRCCYSKELTQRNSPTGPRPRRVTTTIRSFTGSIWTTRSCAELNSREVKPERCHANRPIPSGGPFRDRPPRPTGRSALAPASTPVRPKPPSSRAP